MRRQSLSPLYAQVEKVLATNISEGIFPAGSRIPSEDSLIERFGVSRTTIRKTIQNLVDHGLLEIRRGTGTFVSQPRITQELTELTGFVEDMQIAGRRPTARVLATQVVSATDKVARQLELTAGTLVVRIERVRLADGVPLSYDETYLPRDIGDKVLQHDLAVEPIFSLIEEKYGIPLVEADYCLEAIAADTDIARALGINVGAPIFRIERTSFRQGNVPIDYEKLHYRGDQIRFTTRLARRTATMPRAASR